MRHDPGTQLGAYVVVSGLGAGGMGEVYRARDTILHREVAIKIVHPDYCHHADSLARLRREARTLAALNHPNVATLHELAEFGGSCGLVMELVGGETLADLLQRRRLKMDDIIRLASQIAAGLDAAHQQGIIHRDLKPANIRVTADGVVKVLDFGLAKAAEDTDGGASTFVTMPGAILGTTPYMSPEQARGSELDLRTDVWSFGCVLFQMFSGRLPFDGSSRSDIIAAIIERDPDWTLLPADTPGPVRRILRRCLEKDPRRRLRDLGDVRLELEDTLNERDRSAAITAPAPVSRPSPSWLHGSVLLATGAALGAVAMLAWTPSTPPTTAAEVRFSITLPEDERLAPTELGGLAMQPDGRAFVYVAARGASTQLMLRPFDGTPSHPLQGTGGAVTPFFSPDGKWIGFFADGKLKKIALAGGPPVTLCDAPDGLGGTWSPLNMIVFASATGGSLQKVSAEGGPASRVTELDISRDEFSHRWPEFLPDGETFLFTVGTVGEWDEAEIVAQSVRGGPRTSILKGGTNPRYLASGHLVYGHDGAVWVTPFDSRRLSTTGTPSRVLEGLTATADGAVQVAAAASGAVVFHPSALLSSRRLVVVEAQSQTPLAAAPHSYVAPRISPDGQKVLLGVSDNAEQIWSYDLASGTLGELTFEASNRSPIWSHDGRRVTFASNRYGAFNLFQLLASAEGPAERLTTAEALQLPGSWSPNGEVLAFTEQNSSTGRDVWLLRRNGDRTPFAASQADESAPRFSPDGGRIAYVSNEGGQSDVYVRDVAGNGPPRRLSTDGGSEPVWRRDGAAVYFRSYGKLLAVAADGGTPRVVYVGGEPGTFDAAGYDVMTGTDRFLMMTTAGAGTSPLELRMILNWSPAVTASSR